MRLWRLEQHIDVDQSLRRERYPEYAPEPKRWSMTTSASVSPSSIPLRRAGGSR